MVSASEPVIVRMVSNSGANYDTTLQVNSTSELRLWVTLADGTASLKTLGTDYSVTLSDTGIASVTFTSPPVSGSKLTFIRATDRDQNLDLITNTRLPAERFEAQFDKLTRLIREQDETRQAIRFPEAEPAGSNSTLPLPAIRANGSIYFDEIGDMQVISMADLSAATVTASTVQTALADDAPGARIALALGSAATESSSAFAPVSHTHNIPSAQITDSTAQGRSLLTAATAALQRASLGILESSPVPLNNVTISSLANRDALLYEASSDKWKNRPITAADIVGGVTPTGAQVITALGYTPANIASPTLTGHVQLSGQSSQTLTDNSAMTRGLSDARYIQSLDIIKVPQGLSAQRQNNPSVSPRIVFFGDSLIGNKRYRLLDDIIPDRFGSYSELGFDFLAMGGEGADAATSVTDRTLWPTQKVRVLSAGKRVKISIDTVVDIAFDEATIYYIKENGAGTFEIQVGPNAGPYTTIGTSIDANNGSAQALGIATIQVPRGSVYSLNIKHISGGSVTIITSRVKKRYDNGLAAYLMDEGGMGILEWNQVQPWVIQGILNNVRPHLFYCQTADNTTTELPELQALIDVYNGFSAVKADQPHWLLIPANTSDTNNSSILTAQSNQAKYLRSIAVANDHSFIDVAPAYGLKPMADGLTGTGNDIHPTDPVGMLMEWTYVFDRLGYLTSSGPYVSQNNSLTQTNRIVTSGLVSQALRDNLNKYFRLPIPTTGTTSNASFVSFPHPGYIRIAENTPNGYSASMTLARCFYSGNSSYYSSGTRFLTNYGLHLVMNGRVQSGCTYRIIIAATLGGIDLTSSGFGLEFRSDGVYIMCHNDTSKSYSEGSLTPMSGLDDYYIVSIWRYGSTVRASNGSKQIEMTTGTPSTTSSPANRYVAFAALNDSGSINTKEHEIGVIQAVVLNSLPAY
jgi:hypothetical protein